MSATEGAFILPALESFDSAMHKILCCNLPYCPVQRHSSVGSWEVCHLDLSENVVCDDQVSGHLLCTRSLARGISTLWLAYARKKSHAWWGSQAQKVGLPVLASGHPAQPQAPSRLQCNT